MGSRHTAIGCAYFSSHSAGHDARRCVVATTLMDPAAGVLHRDRQLFRAHIDATPELVQDRSQSSLASASARCDSGSANLEHAGSRGLRFSTAYPEKGGGQSYTQALYSASGWDGLPPRRDYRQTSVRKIQRWVRRRLRYLRCLPTKVCSRSFRGQSLHLALLRRMK